jgi:hypothetical protein
LIINTLVKDRDTRKLIARKIYELGAKAQTESGSAPVLKHESASINNADVLLSGIDLAHGESEGETRKPGIGNGNRKDIDSPPQFVPAHNFKTDLQISNADLNTGYKFIEPKDFTDKDATVLPEPKFGS